jgi:hypothetical protein
MAFQNGNKPIVTNGLVYALDFGNTKSYTSGTNTARSLVYDTAVTTVTGSSGLPTLVNGILNITSSQFIRRTGSIDSIDPNGAFTISLVARPVAVGSLLTQNLVGKVFQIQSTPSSSNIGFNLGTVTYSRTIPGFNSGSLQHISFRYNSGSIDTFLNGIPVTSSIANATIFPTPQLNALFFGSGSNSFSGSLANLYVYNRALSVDEIYENYLVMAGRYNLPVVPKPYSIDENAYQWVQATNTTDTNTISAISTFISGLKSNGLWNKLQVIYPFVGATTGSQTVNLKEPGLYRLGLTGSFSASNAGLYPSSSTSFVDSIPGTTVYPLVNSASAHLSLLSYDLPTGNGFLGGNSLPALGGEIIARSGSKVYHAFTMVGTSSFTPLTNAISNVEVMVVAGGGGAGFIGGGGGAGGLVYSSSFTITPGATVQIIVGDGGVAGNRYVNGGNGGNSSFSTIVATGGGGGGSYVGSGILELGTSGSNGGSGGGGGGSDYETNIAPGGTGSIGQGNNGYQGARYYGSGAGGGGGAGAAAISKNGGSGSYFPQFTLLGGSPAGWFAGGGGGERGGKGGIGGGMDAAGVSGTSTPLPIYNYIRNTGGGGGSANTSINGWSIGGSGIVIVGYDVSSISATTGSGTGLYITETGITGSVNSQFTAGITGSGTIGFLTVSRTGSGVFSIHKNNVSQSIASASLGALSTDIFFNTANLAGSGSLPLQANLAYASIGAGLTTSEVATYYNLVSQLQTNLKRKNTLLDTYTGSAAAYSLRRIGPSGYFGPAIRVRRDSDNTLRDIGFTSDGQLDTVGLLDFVGVTGSGFVNTWYDQSGNGRNATQVIAGAQPFIILSGSVTTEDNKVTIYSNGGKSLVVGNLIGPSHTWFSVHSTKPGSGGTVQVMWMNGTPGYVQLIGYSANGTYPNGTTSEFFRAGMGGAGGYGGYWGPRQLKTNIYTEDYILSDYRFGQLNHTQTFTQPIAASGGTLTFGPWINGGTEYNRWSEFIYYTGSTQSINRTAIESNLNSYYKIYGSATASFDPDYQAFITATGITQPTQSAALETLVSDLKSYGLWSKMKAVYPMITDKYNLYSNTETFSSGWLVTNSTVTASNASGPFTSNLVANRLNEISGSSVTPLIYQTVALNSGSVYVMSVHARWNNRNYIVLNPDGNSSTWFDIRNGFVSSSIGTVATASITRVSGTSANPSGSWYRCAMVFTCSVSAPVNTSIQVANTDGSFVYDTTTSNSGSFLWGAQIEPGDFISPYLSNNTNNAFTTGSIFDQMKFNLKDPRDTDNAFRLTRGGNMDARYTGFKGDGTSGYLDTNLVSATALNPASMNLSVYVRTTVGTNQSLIATRYSAAFNQLLTGGSNNFRVNFNSPTNWDSATNSLTGVVGFALASKTSVNSIKVYRNTALVTEDTRTTGTDGTIESFAIGSYKSAGVYSLFGRHETSFATIGNGLTDYEAKALYWIVQKYQTTLGRQVY